MTEYWKSNPHFWCEYCKVWMNDNPSARATHERGIKHQENVARKLRQMRQQADTEKRGQAEAGKYMAKIEARANRAYKEDLESQRQAEEKLTGIWVEDAGTGYMYNAGHRYYFDRTTGMYYGGEPVAWTVQPAIPPEALYKAWPASGKNAPQKNSAVTQGQAVAPAAAGITAASRAGQTAGKHPLACLGGYQMPASGAIGGAKGIGGQRVAQYATGTSQKRRRQDKGSSGTRGTTANSQEEQEAIERREAARMRVQQRTMHAFGLK